MANQKSLVVDVDKRQVIQTLDRIGFGDHSVDEKLLQEMLAVSPGCLPLDEFGSNFAPAACIGREILNADLLYISADGFITIVETKLWKNPEARRTAVAQVLDYAKRLSGWSYEQLEESVQRKLGLSDSLYDWLCANEETGEAMPSEQVFIDTVSRNLSAGHFLLLIVGDGIREGVRGLTESLNQAPQLGFTFGLVEMVCYQWGNGQLLLSPSVIARTKEIERAVVRIEMKPTSKNQVEVSVTTNVNDVTTTPELQVFMETLSDRAGPQLAQQLEAFTLQLDSTSDDIEIVCNKKYLVKCHYTENDRDKSLWIFSVTKTGKVAIGGQTHWKVGSPATRRVIEEFWNSVREIIPGLLPKKSEKGNMSRPSCPLSEFLLHREQLESMIMDYVDSLNSLD